MITRTLGLRLARMTVVGITLMGLPVAAWMACAKEPTAAATQAHGESLFNGKDLGSWKVADFAGAGEPRVENGAIVLPAGERLTGVHWAGEALPKMNYEIALSARRVDGSDFFCGLTFPVGDSFATFVAGGWGGATCGISSIDDEDAAHNDTHTYQHFDENKWYRFRVRVLPDKLQAWIDDKQVVDVTTTGKKVGLRADIDESKPVGLASFQTTAEVKDIVVTPIEGAGNATRPSR